MTTETGKVPLAGFKRVRHVTRPQLKLTPGVEYYVKFQGPAHLGEKVADNKDPATLIDVVDLRTGEEMNIIAPAVFLKELNKAYPGESYIGKSFAFELMKVPEKRYNLLKTFIEIAPEETPKPAVVAGKR